MCSPDAAEQRRQCALGGLFVAGAFVASLLTARLVMNSGYASARAGGRATATAYHHSGFGEVDRNMSVIYVPRLQPGEDKSYFKPAHITDKTEWYSQVSQDQVVFHLFNRQQGGFFVDMAANDPYFISNTRGLEKHGWNGLCIEGNPLLTAHLAQYRSCAVVGAAMSDAPERGSSVNFRVQGDDPGGEGHVMGGIVNDKFDNKDASNRDKSKLEVTVNAYRLQDILTSLHAPKTIDYLSLDIEGAEYYAMKDFDFAKYNISITTIERAEPKLAQLLMDNGFEYFCTNGWFGDDVFFHKSFALSKEMQALVDLHRVGFAVVKPGGPGWLRHPEARHNEVKCTEMVGALKSLPAPQITGPMWPKRETLPPTPPVVPPAVGGGERHNAGFGDVAHELAVIYIPTLAPGEDTSYFGSEEVSDDREWYSTDQQDRVVSHLVGGHAGFFLDVGANDPFHASNTRGLEKKGWRGVCVEGNPLLTTHLAQYRSCAVVGAALADKPRGSIAQYRVEGGPGPGKEGQVDTKTKAKAHALGGIVGAAYDNKPDASISRKFQIGVNPYGMRNVLGALSTPARIDYLSLDLAGAQYEALRAFDFAQYTVSLATVDKAGEDALTLLLAKGFNYFCTNGASEDDLFFHESFELAQQMKKIVQDNGVGKRARREQCAKMVPQIKSLPAPGIWR